MEGKNMISYCKYFNSQSDVHTVSHDDLDSNSVDVKYFVEILKGLEVVRPYYDLDEEKINNKQDWDNFIAELERLRGSLGAYCIAGYTTDKALHEITGLKYYESIVGLPADKEQKKISMHVVFYEAVVKTSDWLEIVKKNSQYEQPKFNYDHDVYKLKTSQLMRHSLSYKPYNPQNVIQCSGNIIVPEDAKNSYVCITPRGNETVLELSEYDDVFPKKTTVDDKVDKLFARHDAKKVVKPRDDKVTIEEELDDIHTIMSVAVSGSTFNHEDMIKDLMLYIPKNNYEMFMKVYKEYYNAVDHKSKEDLDKIYDDTIAKGRAKGFCQVMSNIKSKYYEVFDGEKISHLKELSKEKLEKVAEDDKTLLDNYKRFMRSWHNIVNEYFDNYDYIHTTASEEKLLQKEVNLKKQKRIKLSNTYKRLYARKVLYTCYKQFIYKKDDLNVEHNTLEDKSFKSHLKITYEIEKVDTNFIRNLKKFKSEALLESSDGLVYPKYRDIDYDYSLTDEQFNEFCTMYKATFKDACCGDFALKILIQDIASGFHDNSGIIKFYYGTGGNNKDCETCIYENIIGVHDLIFKTHDYKVLADEKNQQIVSSLYVQFNEMPANSREKFMEFVNALKNYNESGSARTRKLYQDFVSIQTNIRFQCNTNNPELRNWLLANANDAIKRRFLVAERVHSDEYSDDLFRFCHDVEKCRALKMYIKQHKDQLYTEKLNNITMLKFFNDNHELYDIYTESDKMDLMHNLKESLSDCIDCCQVAKRTMKSEVTYTIELNRWCKAYRDEFDKKITLKQFKELILEFMTACKNCYVDENNDGKFVRKSDRYLFRNEELIDFIKNHDSSTPQIETD